MISPTVQIIEGDCLVELDRLAAEGVLVDSACMDPPYHLASIVDRFGAADAAAPASGGATGVYTRSARGFMGQTWDGGDVAFRPETWAKVAAVMKPGAYLTAFSATRSYHRMACAIEDAGFEIRDSLLNLVAGDAAVLRFMESLNDEQRGAFLLCLDESAFGGLLAWVYGSGFPKSHDFAAVPGSKKTGRDVRAGFVGTPFEAGWGTALKPAFEPIVFARKPLVGTIAENVLGYGTGGLNIDGCRIPTDDVMREGAGGLLSHVHDGKDYPRGRSGQASAERRYDDRGATTFTQTPGPRGGDPAGRWPANLMHDGSFQVVSLFPIVSSGKPGVMRKGVNDEACYGAESRPTGTLMTGFGDSGSAARFFYSAKADAGDRAGSRHPTVKPVDLMRWLVRLITPPGGVVLDCFAGSGTTGEAALLEGMSTILIEREATYAADIRRRLGRGIQLGGLA